MNFESCEFTNWFLYDAYLFSYFYVWCCCVCYTFGTGSFPGLSNNPVRFLPADPCEEVPRFYPFIRLLFAQTSDLHSRSNFFYYFSFSTTVYLTSEYTQTFKYHICSNVWATRDGLTLKDYSGNIFYIDSNPNTFTQLSEANFKFLETTRRNLSLVN